jgi:hypothetical protein
MNEHIGKGKQYGTHLLPGAELGLFVRRGKINIIKYNIYFNLLYMSCKTKPT